MTRLAQFRSAVYCLYRIKVKEYFRDPSVGLLGVACGPLPPHLPVSLGPGCEEGGVEEYQALKLRNSIVFQLTGLACLLRIPHAFLRLS